MGCAVLTELFFVCGGAKVGCMVHGRCSELSATRALLARHSMQCIDFSLFVCLVSLEGRELRALQGWDAFFCASVSVQLLLHFRGTSLSRCTVRALLHAEK